MGQTILYMQGHSSCMFMHLTTAIYLWMTGIPISQTMSSVRSPLSNSAANKLLGSAGFWGCRHDMLEGDASAMDLCRFVNSCRPATSVYQRSAPIHSSAYTCGSATACLPSISTSKAVHALRGSYTCRMLNKGSYSKALHV